MKLDYEWKITFPLLLTIIGMIGSYVYAFYLNHRNRRREKIQALENIYSEARYLIDYPVRKNNSDESYHNENEYIEKAVRRKINDFRHEVDNYWSYYNQTFYPDLEELPDSEKQKLIPIIEKEIEEYMNSSMVPDPFVLSPVYYIDDRKVKDSINHICNYTNKHRSSFDKKIQELAEQCLDHPVDEVKKKYAYQLEYDKDYFKYNEPLFLDPYRKLIITIRNTYERYSTGFLLKIIDKTSFKLLIIKIKLFRKKTA